MRKTPLQLFHFFKRGYSNRNILSLSKKGFWADIFPHEATNDLSNLLVGQPQVIYAGFDPTAGSLHLGHLVVIQALLHAQRAGHSVIGVIGGATALIGDPTGRTAERPQLDHMTVRSNAIRLEKQLRRIFDNHEKYFWEKSDPLVPLKVLNNMDWYEQFGIVDFLQEVGRHLRMNAMISRQSVKTRLDGSGLSFTEFTYQAMQAYDWLHLFRKFKCRVQIGGNDQIGNIVTGHDLLSRAENTQVYGLTVPLVTAESGDKYGKSAGNALWLDPEMTLPFDLHQFFLRLPDPIAETFLHLFSFLPQSQVEQLVENHLLAPEKRIPHKYLAENVVTLVHGVEGLQSAQRATEALFQNSAEALCDMSQDELSCLLRGAPQVSLLLKPGTTILDAAMQAKCFLTERDAHRIITSGGFYVNQRKVTNPNIVLIEGEHILPNRMTVARVGKKSHVLIRWAI